MSFWLRKESSQNSNYQRLWQTIDSRCLVLEGSAGEAVCRGGERGGVMLSDLEDFAGEHSVKDLARRSNGGGGSMGYCPFRRPRNSFLFAIAFVCFGLWDCGFVVSLWVCGLCVFVLVCLYACIRVPIVARNGPR